ncbi:MAG: flagellar assembly protein FliX [Alphaproteobacteria bacterium]|nr:MAG: flagellar assembly protein FliX [Alphaproteobacteria bacterium]
MKISGPGQVQSKSIKKTSSKKGTSGASFAGALSDAAPASASHSVGGASPIASVDALLALQEVPDATQGRSKGLKRANEMLDMLEEVRKGLLLGAIPAANLRTLADLARNQRGKSGDPRLDSIMADIELRAEVELAKLGV